MEGVEGSVETQAPAAGRTQSTVLPENPNDANVCISFTEKDMEAWGDFMPAVDDGQPLSYDHVLNIFEKLNIRYGIQTESIQDAVLACNTKKNILKNILLARGSPPVNEIAEYTQLNPHLGKTQVPTKNQKIDHREYSPFIIVRKGQALAKQKSRKPGQNGTNIHGDPVPFGITRNESVTGGENTRMEGRLLISAINGQLVQEKMTLHVRESLHIKGPVGYKTGNITFPGDVIIEGPVSDGFKIYSGGSITIRQTFDVTDAIAKGDLNVAGGIIGRGRALVKVGGSLRTKFIENCRVACRKSIAVSTEIINSQLYTLENVEMGEKSFIIGSEIYSVHGVRAAGIGRKGVKAAKIHCGIDFTLQQEKDKNNNMLRLLAAKLERLKQLLEDPQNQGEKGAKLEELRLKLEGEQRTASEKVSELMGRINSDENAAVEVSGEIAEGTLIEICQIALFVTEPIKRVRITLDRASGRLLSTPI